MPLSIHMGKSHKDTQISCGGLTDVPQCAVCLLLQDSSWKTMLSEFHK